MTHSTSDRMPPSSLDLSLARIEEAVRTIDPVFLSTPQFIDEQLSAALGRQVVVKVETANPLRSFKGRGADFVMGRLDARQSVVCASTGNFGQAMAYAGRRRGVGVEVFVPTDVDPVKLARMKAFGARVTSVGRDSAECEMAARTHAATTPGCVFIQDGVDRAALEATVVIEALVGAAPVERVLDGG